MWDRQLEKDPYMSHVYTYIWENDAGCAQAYLTVLHEKLEQGKGFTVTDWAYTTRESLLGVFGFLKRLAPSGNRRTILTMQGGVDPFQMFSEQYGVEICCERGKGAARLSGEGRDGVQREREGSCT